MNTTDTDKTETDVDIGKKWLRVFSSFQGPAFLIIAIEMFLYYTGLPRLTFGGSEISLTVVLVVFGISALSGFYLNYIAD